MSALYAFSPGASTTSATAASAPTPSRAASKTPWDLLDRVRRGAVADDDTDPVAVALADAARRFPLPLEGLDELIDGVLMDVARPHLRHLGRPAREYCRCVAGAIGRLSSASSARLARPKPRAR